jgi:hypothetical protein
VPPGAWAFTVDGQAARTGFVKDAYVATLELTHLGVGGKSTIDGLTNEQWQRIP